MTNQSSDKKEVLMKCKRGVERSTEGQSCDSLRAYRLGPDMVSKAPRFKCAKCGYEWIVPIGGQFVGM